jgi:hypothetical protein
VDIKCFQLNKRGIGKMSIISNLIPFYIYPSELVFLKTAFIGSMFLALVTKEPEAFGLFGAWIKLVKDEFRK